MPELVVDLAGLGLVGLLVVPFRRPRVGMAIGLVLAVVGIAIYFDRSTDEWAYLFDDISRAIGTATTIYAALRSAATAGPRPDGSRLFRPSGEGISASNGSRSRARVRNGS